MNSRIAGFLVAAVLALLITGCGEDRDNLAANGFEPGESAAEDAQPMQTAEGSESMEADTPREDLSDIEAYWQRIAPEAAMKQWIYPLLDDEQPLAYYVQGLANSDPLVRWFCAYKVTDFAKELTDADRQAVAALLNDSDADVVLAARFASELLDRTYAGEAFARTADGKLTAYYKYREARYNDGAVYLVRDEGEPEMIFREPSVHELKFSPNGRYLAVGNEGRIWQAVHLYDLTTKEWTRLQDAIGEVLAAEAGPYRELDAEQVDPTYRWAKLQEWSPDGGRFVFFYHFEYEGEDYEGYAVYDLEGGGVSRVMPITETQPDPIANLAW